MNETLLQVIEQKHSIRILFTLENNGQSFCDIVKSVGINTATLEKRLKNLEANELVVRTPCPQDARCVGYTLSEEGGQLVSKLKKVLR